MRSDSVLDRYLRWGGAKLSVFFYIQGYKGANPNATIVDAVRDYCDRFAPAADEVRIRNDYYDQMKAFSKDKIDFSDDI